MNTLSHHHPLCATDPGAAEAFQRLAAAGYNRIPVACETLVDFDTPLSIYLKLADEANTYLLESVQGGEKWGRYSIIGLPARRQERRLVDEIGQVRAGKAGGERSHRVGLHAGVEPDLAEVHAQDVGAPAPWGGVNRPTTLKVTLAATGWGLMISTLAATQVTAAFAAAVLMVPVGLWLLRERRHLPRPLHLLQRLPKPAVFKECRATLAHGVFDHGLLKIEGAIWHKRRFKPTISTLMHLVCNEICVIHAALRNCSPTVVSTFDPSGRLRQTCSQSSRTAERKTASQSA